MGVGSGRTPVCTHRGQGQASGVLLDHSTSSSEQVLLSLNLELMFFLTKMEAIKP